VNDGPTANITFAAASSTSSSLMVFLRAIA
jgi:hypothetical protein